MLKCWGQVTPEPPKLPSKQELQEGVMEFNKHLDLPLEKIQGIEFKSCDQNHSSLSRYSVCRYRLTASYFGAAGQRYSTTSPPLLVLQILGTSSFTFPATKWGKANEQEVILLYQEKQIENGHDGLFCYRSGLVISEDHPFLEASPDAMVLDPSVPYHFGLADTVSILCT